MTRDLSTPDDVKPTARRLPVDGVSGELYPLSPLQQGMYFHWRLAPNSGTDVEQAVVDLDELIDAARMQQAWMRVVRTFPVLRTQFESDGLSVPMQRIMPEAAPEFSVVDMRSMETDAQGRRFEEFLRSDRLRGFDLDRVPAMRVSLFQLADTRWTLVWTFHHILVDGRTFDGILQEVFSAYSGETAPHVDARPYREYVDWVTAQDQLRAIEFWRNRLRGFAAPTAVPADHAPSGSGDRFGQKEFALPAAATSSLRELAEREGLSLNVVLMGAWAFLLFRLSGEQDVVFGASKTTRRGTVEGAEAIVGMLLATIPVRLAVEPGLSVGQWLKCVRAEWIALRGFEHLPLVDIKQASEVPTSAPLFETLVMYDDHQFGTRLRALGNQWSGRRFRIVEQTGLPLTLLGYGEASMALKILFDASRFDDRTIDRIGSQLIMVLDAWAADSNRLLGDTPTLIASPIPPADRKLLLDTWQHTARKYDESVCVHEHFERQTERSPDAIAVIYGDAKLSYRELNRRANHLARQLQSAGVGPEVLVGIAVERSLDMMIALLGILKAGGAYVPMDPAYPRDRLAMMLEDSKAPIIVTQRHLRQRIPTGTATVILVDELRFDTVDAPNISSGVVATNLAYVIFTSGSTGRPKGTMLEHRNVANFFAAMDDVMPGPSPGVWLALTSISFDISVLELFWTLARGFKVVIAPEADRASLESRARPPSGSTKPIGFGLFYFAADSARVAAGDAYRLLIEGAKFADVNGFEAVWTPERHFHAFGGLYPNPAVTTAALSTITKRVALRAGSVVLPLHNPIRVAEDWAVIDQLSGGRVGLSFASGWHANDFAVMPENYARRREIMVEYIDTVLKLWRGEKVSVKNGNGESIEVSVLPRGVQARPPIWIASAGSAETFVFAGRIGANILTNMLGQDLADLAKNFAAYRAARREHGHDGDGIISVMLHTFVTDSTEAARDLARKPFSDYLASSFDLVKLAPKMFPAFKQPSRDATSDVAIDHTAYTPEDMAALLDHAFDRYFETAGLFGTPERALEMVDKLAGIGATEMACLIDFGIDPEVVLGSLPHLHRLQEMCRARAIAGAVDVRGEAIDELIERHAVTHLQCTPSMARMLADDPRSLGALARLDTFLLGGEALPADLAERLATTVRGRVLNMYGPTETTVWSTSSVVTSGRQVTIGRPISNTTIRILDDERQLVPIGDSGELYIGGDGVARGYLGRPDLTAERFVADPFSSGARLYRTGDVARYRVDGEIEFLGRLDHQLKLDGHRIELGEIETTLNRHPAVRQSVVVPRQLDGSASPSLVAYVVLDKPEASVEPDAGRVAEWERIWDETYQVADHTADPRFRIAGWNDSYTGEPIPAAEMREWLDNTVRRIVALRPRRVLEIGCGTGMILYGVLPDVDHYTGVDISPAALDSIRKEMTAAEATKVTLLLQPAHALDGVSDRSYDIVVINSVVQYFPDADYLARVIRRATDLVVDGGHIFVGDVRSLDHLEAFHLSIELAQAPATSTSASIRANVDRRIEQESELLLSERFFQALTRDNVRLSAVHVELKRGASRNELTTFRYDVVLDVGPKPSAHPTVRKLEKVGADSLATIRSLIDSEPPVIELADVLNARLAGIAAVKDALRSNRTPDAGSLRAVEAAHENAGVDPEALYALDDRYVAELRWAQSGDPMHFDAQLRHKRLGGAAAQHDDPPAAALDKPGAHANTPARSRSAAQPANQLASYLKSTLPAYMIPATFVVMDVLPLTPNGKIDRKALPDPGRRSETPSAEYVAPASDLETTIAGIWKELLAVERVGRRDNIFDLGANSLLTMQANNRLSAKIGKKVSLISMFRFPTVASLAAHLSEIGEQSAAGDDKRSNDRASRAEQAAKRRRALRAEKNR